MAKDNAGVIAPPPLIYLGVLALGLALEHFALPTTFATPAPPRYAIAGVLIAAGVALLLSAAGLFRKAGTAMRPWEPSTALVIEGVYRITRNPMYLGMSLVFAAIALAADSVLTLALLIPAMAVIQFGVIAREERYMEGKFGEAYRAYKARVRRWI